jgi:hypothetical protein
MRRQLARMSHQAGAGKAQLEFERASIGSAKLLRGQIMDVAAGDDPFKQMELFRYQADQQIKDLKDRTKSALDMNAGNPIARTQIAKRSAEEENAITGTVQARQNQMMWRLGNEQAIGMERIKADMGVRSLRMAHRNNEAELKEIEEGYREQIAVARRAHLDILAEKIEKEAMPQALDEARIQQKRNQDRTLRNLDAQMNHERLVMRGQSLAAEVQQVRESYAERIRIAQENGEGPEVINRLGKAGKLAEAATVFDSIMSMQRSNPGIDARAFGGAPVTRESFESENIQSGQLDVQKSIEALMRSIDANIAKIASGDDGGVPVGL